MAEEFIFDSDNLITFCSDFEYIPSDELTDSVLEVNLQDLNDRWTQVTKSYRLLCTIKDEAIDDALIDSARHKYSACTKAFHKCKSMIFDAQKILVAPRTSESHEFIQSGPDTTFSSIKVPPCDTEIFYGGYEEWPSFRDMFTAVYVEHPKLSSVQKLFHLRLKVRGQAGGIVKKYQLCGENFSLAWEALKARYENKRVLVDNQLKILLNMSSISSESSESLQQIQATINDVLAALKAQNISTADWDPILVYLCSTKLPHETLSLWEQSLKSHRDLPKWQEMDAFLSNRYEVVERLNSIQGVKSNTKKKSDAEVNSFNTESVSQFPCRICKSPHALKNCPEFKGLDVQSRFDFVSKNKICLNCLSYTHFRKECTSKFTCSQCKRNHHSLLHFTKSNSQTSRQGKSPNTACMSDEQPSTSAQGFARSTSAHFASSINSPPSENTLLPTAIVQIEHRGEIFNARAFLDQGSEKTFISNRLQQRLMLPTEYKSFQIRGIGGQIVGNSNALCNLTLVSKKFDKLVNMNAIVVPKITRLLPSFSVSKSDFPFNEVKNLELADPDFHSPGQVDLLIGSNVIPTLLLDGVMKVCNSLLAQATIFGWIISGPIETTTVSTFAIEATEISNDPIEKQLRMFWEQEEVPNKHTMSEDDEYCELLYQKTTVRNSDGRYVVKLPFKKAFPQDLPLDNSRSTALAQYFRMEQSLKAKPELAQTYSEVLKEYLTLNHMEHTSSQERLSRGSYSSYYLPHHAVLKPESRSTKVRVVFNASKRTRSGNSLNDVLHVGPTLQTDIMTLLLKWRLYRFVFNGDIEKMYRQILVHNDDLPFQRILFRTDPLARDNQDAFPQASNILQKEIYVDDILSGAHDVHSAVESLSQVITVLNSAGFPLKKITSNCAEILNSVPKENLLDSDFLKFQEKSATKTLGIQWNALSDSFSYNVDPPQTTTAITKRQILSTVAKLFDPAGWISPIIVQAKMLLQQLWLEGSGWDENVKPDTLVKWNKFVENLPMIATLKIPRWVKFAPSLHIQIHGFCDASEKAYCAVVYLRIQTETSVSTNLLVSKGKVAPIDPVSLPRLELSGAVLLSKLVKQITSSLPCWNYDLHLWCDSSIVLGWLEKPPCTWKTYVANRTSQIMRNVGNVSWRHVRSADNPADLGTRGCSPEELINNSLWWHGPSWLQSPPEEWPRSMIIKDDPPEMKKKVEVFHVFADNNNNDDEKDDNNTNEDILKLFSKWDKAIRIMSYIYRFINKMKKGLQNNSRQQLFLLSKREDISPAEAISIMIKAAPLISQQEFLETKYRMIAITQIRHYGREYHSLANSSTVSRKSPLYPLNPFLDNHNVIRANGRISNSDFPYNERHPVIIPVSSQFCQLFISFVHNFLMHAENNLMLRTIRQEYYVSRLRSGIRKYIRSCITCTLYKQKVMSQIMAALPKERSTFSLPFTITGVDFAGPFSTKTSIVRNAPYHKSYVCIFICFCTKAIHLELCSDLSAGSFRAAFTRFVGRRGLPQKMMSDNGTNFVGAERALHHEYEEFIKETSKDIMEKYSSHGFQWSFIPPNAPHMGGIWEAGVKSFKMHFRKVAQNQKYTFEEFSTLLTRIEAVLNSRPLSPMSDDPSELLALTPGHFLRGAPLVAIPEAQADALPLRDRWERLKYHQHQFSQRWKDEYLKELQRRYKWQHKEENLKVDQLVVVKDDLLPPCEWRLGRIKRIYVGHDGLVRVADIRTQAGTITRAIVKLCVLPIESSPDALKQTPRNPAVHQCLVCRRYHSLRFCKQFLALSIEGRRRMVRQHGYCQNCLARSHTSNDCTSADVCQKCGWGHHTLLHVSSRTHNTQQRLQRQPPQQRVQRQPPQQRVQRQQLRQQQRVQRQQQISRQRQRNHRDTQQQNRDLNRRLGRQPSNERLNHAVGDNPPSPRRILRGALRALERLAKTL